MKKSNRFPLLFFLIVPLAVGFVGVEAVFSTETTSRVDESDDDNPALKDLALEPVPILRPLPEKYVTEKGIHFQAAPAITVSQGGRLWASWIRGGIYEDNDNYVILKTSGDGGETWSPPVFALDFEGRRRTFEPSIWTDPDGKVWWFWGQSFDFWDGRGGIWAMVADNPDNEKTAWTPPRRLCDGFMKNKPIVTSDGEWWLPVEQWRFRAFVAENVDGKIRHRHQNVKGSWVHDRGDRKGTNVYHSKDRGKTWEFLAQAKLDPKRGNFDEHMILEQKDGSFRLLQRTNQGIWESFSTDRGRTWSEVRPSPIKNPSARFHFTRLASGNILLVKNGPIDTQTDRREMTAFLSEDEGKTFPHALLLDARVGVSYPDACQDHKGTIYIVHDFDRQGAGEIVLHRFTEADVKAGKIVSKSGKLKTVISRNEPK